MAVILIGGVGGTGKTLLAKQLMKKLHIPYVCIDHLMMGMLRSETACGFSVDDSAETIGQAMWPLLVGFIKTNIENQHSIILEGFQLQPELIAQFEEPYRSQLLSVFVGFSEVHFRAGQFAKIEQYRHVVEQRLPETYDLEMLVQSHQQLQANCQKSEMPFFELDGDYNNKMQQLTKWIAERYEQF